MRKQLFVLAGLVGAASITANTQAAFIEVVITDGTVDGTWQTAVLSVSGLSSTNRLSAISGLPVIGADPALPMSFTTGNGSSLFNHADVDLSAFGLGIISGEVAFAMGDLSFFGFPTSQFDSGVFPLFGTADTAVSPGFTTEIVSFSFSGGTSDSSTNVAIFDFDPDTPEFGPSLQVFRLTWNRLTSLTVEFNVEQVGLASEFLSITLPAIPAPGAFALLGLAGLVGRPRRCRT